jgi:glutaredoxin
MAKEFLKKNSIAFEDIDVGRDQGKAQEMLEKSGQAGVPVIEIDNKIIIGFDIEEISKELNIK